MDKRENVLLYVFLRQMQCVISQGGGGDNESHIHVYRQYIIEWLLRLLCLFFEAIPCSRS